MSESSAVTTRLHVRHDPVIIFNPPFGDGLLSSKEREIYGAWRKGASWRVCTPALDLVLSGDRNCCTAHAIKCKVQWVSFKRKTLDQG